MDRESALKALLESHKLGKELGIQKYFGDFTDAVNNNPIIENYSFTYEDMAVPEINKHARVAAVVKPEDHSHDFIETLSRNAGFDFTIFRDKEEAIQHLKSDE